MKFERYAQKIDDSIITWMAEMIKNNPDDVNKFLDYFIPSYEIFIFSYKEATLNNDTIKLDYLNARKKEIVKWFPIRELNREVKNEPHY